MVAQKELRGNNDEPHYEVVYEVVYCKSMQKTADGEVSLEKEAHTLDPRGNYPNGACSPQSYQSHKPYEDYGPSFLHNGLADEATAPRGLRLRLMTSESGHQAMAYCTLAPVIDAKAISSTWSQQLGLASPQQ